MPSALDVQRRRVLSRLVIGIVLANLVVAAVGANALAKSVEHPLERVVATTTSTTTSTVPATLPEPDAPSSAYADEPEIILGTIQVPGIDLDANLYQGTSLSSIDRGPSQWPGTALPGHLGNVVVAGHRVTHSHPFRRMDELGPGDVATFTTNEGTFTYEYVSTDVVAPTRVDIITQSKAYTATFFACHPPGSARYRIVTHWNLVSAPALGQPDPSSLPPA